MRSQVRARAALAIRPRLRRAQGPQARGPRAPEGPLEQREPQPERESQPELQPEPQPQPGLEERGQVPRASEREPQPEPQPELAARRVARPRPIRDE